MLEYKTRAMPCVPFKGVKKREFYGELSLETANAAIAPVGRAIEEEARGGWILHGVECLPQRLVRKKSIIELLLGWIPILGGLICKNIDETRTGVDVYLYVMTFVKES